MKIIYMQSTIDYVLREHSSRFEEIQSLGEPQVRQIHRDGEVKTQYYVVGIEEI